MEKLKEPFPISAIHWRIGATNKKKVNPPTKGIALAYLDARDVMKRLDDVCGEGWQCKYSHVTSQGVVCDIGILITHNVKVEGMSVTENKEWLWRANGAGETQVEGEKGAMSDAFKRAAVLWGIGRYLYYLPSVWVDLDNSKFTPPELPDWATPEGYRKSLHSKKMMKEAVKQALEHLKAGDGEGIREVVGELSPEEELVFWGKFNSQERTAMKTYLGE